MYMAFSKAKFDNKSSYYLAFLRYSVASNNNDFYSTIFDLATAKHIYSNAI